MLCIFSIQGSCVFTARGFCEEQSWGGGPLLSRNLHYEKLRNLICTTSHIQPLKIENWEFLSDRCFLTANHIKPGPESLGCSVFFPYKALVCSLLADFARSNHGEEGLCFHAQLTLSWKVRVEADLTAAGWFQKRSCSCNSVHKSAVTLYNLICSAQY